MHSNVWNNSSRCVQGLIHACDMTYSLGIDNILVCSGEVIEFLIFTHCYNVCSKVVMVGHLCCSC